MKQNNSFFQTETLKSFIDLTIMEVTKSQLEEKHWQPEAEE